ncbi:MAG: hypothetical protein GPOALKHO_000060 [Sodalis sp.]|nr:MAG: hypothetical protein GPOALKHO_000060 [Sodalis sp.]
MAHCILSRVEILFDHRRAPVHGENYLFRALQTTPQGL